ncbi:hypothetical protein [Nonomuraea longicatena]|uniref:hypothetical protein n=1 Tax=Nonomuraea longicatena TaxID=83682 RepID=UPI0031DE1609
MLAIAISVVTGMRESRPIEPPFAARIDTVEVEGRILLLHAFTLETSEECLKAEKAEAAESEMSVRVRATLRDICPTRERTLLEKWLEEIWPRFHLGHGGGVPMSVTLDRPLGHRKVIDEEGREVRVCPIVGTRVKTMRRCLMSRNPL